jgi:membrane dipeptidase
MMVDLSHTSERTVTDVLRLTDVPLIASHSGARSISDHPRNLSDAQIQAIASQGGVVQVLFVPSFLNTSRLDPQGDQAFGDLWTRMKAHYSVHAMGTDPAMDAAFESDFRDLLARFPAPPATVRDVADHIDHVVKVAGIDHVGVGSDFDGGGHLEDCRDISELPHLTAELLRRGYSEADLQKLWSENLFRVFEEVIERAKGA